MSSNIPKCAYCKSNNTELRTIIKNKDRHFLVPELKNLERKWFDCKSCKICFSIPRLTTKQIKYMYSNYRSESFRGETPDEYFDRITSYPPEESENLNKSQWIIKNINKEWKPNTILDIGCGGGVLLYTLSQLFKSAELFGIEPTKTYAELASRRTSALVENGYFEKESFKNLNFDLITCCQVLEHVADIDAFLINLKEIAHKDSYIYIEVPDISDFTTLKHDHFIFSEPSHLWYFSSNSLFSIFESHGYKILSKEVTRTVRGRNDLRFLLIKP